MTQDEVVSALLTIRPGAQWTWNFADSKNSDYAGLVWMDTVQPKPTLAEIQLAIPLSRSTKLDAQNKLKDKTASTDDKMNALITLLGL